MTKSAFRFESLSLILFLLTSIWSKSVPTDHTDVRTKISEHPVVIVLSFDGFRHDYMSKTETPNLDELSGNGVGVPFMRSQFMTKTFPNHQSIATGLYTESHGISDNSFFDPVYNRTLDAFTPEFWNYDPNVVPIWIRNEWAGRISGTVMWPGSNHPYGLNESLPTHYERWNASWTFEDRVDLLLSWVTDPVAPADMIFMYLEEPDGYGHVFGPDSDEMIEQIQIVDQRVGYLMDGLKSLGVYEEVNLIILSDHGFVEIEQSKIMNISDLVDPLLYTRTGGSPVWHIYPNSENYNHVHEVFKTGSENMNYTVYTKEELLEDWHFGKNRRIGPIVLISDLGFVFDDFYQTILYSNEEFNLTANADRVYGHHGFDSRSEAMRAFFVAHGPAFEKGVTLDPFDNIDIVPLICQITGLPKPPTNGSLAPFTNVLATHLGSPNSLQVI